MRKNLVLLLVPLLLGGCSFYKKEQKLDLSNVEIPNADHEYFEVQDYHIKTEEIFKQNLGTYFVYFYSTNCNHCQELKNWIIETALSREDIFFIKGSNKDIIKNDVSKTIGATRPEEIEILGYPTLLKIVDKKLVKNVAGKTKIIELLS